MNLLEVDDVILKKRMIMFCFITILTVFGKVNTSCSNTVFCESNKTKVTKEMFASDIRYPQTIIHDIVMNFLSTENTGKEKKVLVLGYDGYREDALINIHQEETSAINTITRDGGIYRSYAGGNGYQDTSTAPGWLSILNGNWAYQVGVQTNDDVKDEKITTFLDEAKALGYSSSFTASWEPHFSVTYSKDIAYQNGKAKFQQMENDEATVNQLKEELSNTSDISTDIIFATLEYADHAGHTYGYGNNVEEYVSATREADNIAYHLIQTIYERETIEKEDWLIIITTDHGGIQTNHGGHSIEEVNTWFAMNKKINELL